MYKSTTEITIKLTFLEGEHLKPINRSMSRIAIALDSIANEMRRDLRSLTLNEHQSTHLEFQNTVGCENAHVIIMLDPGLSGLEPRLGDA